MKSILWESCFHEIFAKNKNGDSTIHPHPQCTVILRFFTKKDIIQPNLLIIWRKNLTPRSVEKWKIFIRRWRCEHIQIIWKFRISGQDQFSAIKLASWQFSINFMLRPLCQKTNDFLTFWWLPAIYNRRLCRFSRVVAEEIILTLLHFTISISSFLANLS